MKTQDDKKVCGVDKALAGYDPRTRDPIKGFWVWAHDDPKDALIQLDAPGYGDLVSELVFLVEDTHAFLGRGYKLPPDVREDIRCFLDDHADDIRAAARMLYGEFTGI